MVRLISSCEQSLYVFRTRRYFAGLPFFLKYLSVYLAVTYLTFWQGNLPTQRKDRPGNHSMIASYPFRPPGRVWDRGYPPRGTVRVLWREDRGAENVGASLFVQF